MHYIQYKYVIGDIKSEAVKRCFVNHKLFICVAAFELIYVNVFLYIFCVRLIALVRKIGRD